MGRAFSRVCLFVRALTGKRLELSTPNLVYVYSRNRSACIDAEVKGQGHTVTKTVTVASDHVPYSAYQYAALHVDTTAYVF